MECESNANNKTVRSILIEFWGKAQQNYKNRLILFFFFFHLYYVMCSWHFGDHLVHKSQLSINICITYMYIRRDVSSVDRNLIEQANTQRCVSLILILFWPQIYRSTKIKKIRLRDLNMEFLSIFSRSFYRRFFVARCCCCWSISISVRSILFEFT